jgi:uncharacterized protein (DUF2336 family)
MAEPAVSYTPMQQDTEIDTIPLARRRLCARLTDLVCLPSTAISPQERHIAGDLLLEMLNESEMPLRQRAARRISQLVDAPSLIIRTLAKDSFEVAEPLLTESEAISDNDLAFAGRAGTLQHRVAIAGRRHVSELIGDVIVAFREPQVLIALARNNNARLSAEAVNMMVAESREHRELIAFLVKRDELAPSQGLTLFWWSSASERSRLLRRFGVERAMMQDSAADIFALAAADNWQDAMTRKALQFIERRQRNRAAIEKSPYDSLEHAVETAERDGMNRVLAEEISYLSGIKPATGAKMFTDPGGEPMAILCKATGLNRAYFDKLWIALRRDRDDDDGDTPYSHGVRTFDTTSNEKAQTILRYWNWSLTSAMSPSVAAAEADDAREKDWSDYSPAALSAHLVFSKRQLME